MKTLSMFLALFFFFSSCQNDDVGMVAETPNLPALNLSNLSYGTHARQVLDVYLPANRLSTTTPVIVLIHGGGWTGGEKADMNLFVPFLQQNYPEYAIVNMNYILATNNHFALPNQVNDVESVLEYVSEHADEWQVKPAYVLLGVSAGGHLAMHYSYSRQPNDVDAVINFVGPCDFNDPSYVNNVLYMMMLGNMVDMNSAPAGMNAIEYASPVSFVSSNSPKTLAFFGTMDPLVPITQKARLETAFAPYPGKLSAHSFVGGHVDFATPQNIAQINNQMTAFMQTVVH